VLNLTEDEKAKICKAEGGTAYLEPSYQLGTLNQMKEKKKSARLGINSIIIEKASSVELNQMKEKKKSARLTMNSIIIEKASSDELKVNDDDFDS